MTISDTQKVDYLWKKIGYSATKTDTSSVKEGFNEAIPSPLQIRGDKIMANAASIPGTIPGANTSVVSVFTTSVPVECTVDGTASTNRTWKTNLTDWISPEFGSTYQIKVYIHTAGSPGTAAASGTQVLAAGSNNNDEWFFDYQSGVLNFIGTNLPNGVSFTGKSVYISGARYISGFGIPAIDLGYISFSGNTISSTQTNGNIVLSPPGTGIVQFYGNLAVGLPVGTDINRPSNPSVGYTRFNTDRDSIEYWGGTQWLAPGELLLSSQVITPDGSSNIYALTSNVNLASSLFVSINGTLQQSNSAYTIVNNNQIQFTETPVTSDIIEIRFLNSATATLTGLQNGSTQVQLDTANINATGALVVTGSTSISGNITVGNVYVPTANNSPGSKGQITYDSSYIYVCVATNTWRRANLAVW